MLEDNNQKLIKCLLNNDILIKIQTIFYNKDSKMSFLELASLIICNLSKNINYTIYTSVNF